jgi:hypothetical protein
VAKSAGNFLGIPADYFPQENNIFLVVREKKYLRYRECIITSLIQWFTSLTHGGRPT